MVSKRAWIRAVAVLGVAVIALAACSSRGDSGGAQAPPNPQAVTEAEDMLLAATQTMFTWYPTEDASADDGYQRALPYLGGRDMRASFNSVTEGSAAMWPQWRKQKVTLTAKSNFSAGTVPADTSRQIQRPIVVTQTEMKPTGEVNATREFEIERVVAKKTADRWQVEEISFFPKNPLRTAITQVSCPPGSAPGTDGRCQPVAAPQTKTCPDGTAVPAGQVCAAQRNQPQTKKCPDGTTVPLAAACANEATQTKQCPDGSTVSVNDQCRATEPEPCPEGQTRDTNGQCVSTAVDCPVEGQVRSDGVCICPSGTVADGGSCVAPCEGDQVRSNGTCGCPAGLEAVGSSCLQPCASGQVRSGASCVCPGGTELVGGQCVALCPAGMSRVNGVCQYPPCPYTGQYRDTADGQCKCGAGRSTEPDGSCGAYIGAPAPGLPGVTSPPRRSQWFRRPPRRRRLLRGLQCCHAGRSPASVRRRY